MSNKPTKLQKELLREAARPDRKLVSRRPRPGSPRIWQVCDTSVPGWIAVLDIDGRTAASCLERGWFTCDSTRPITVRHYSLTDAGRAQETL